MFLPALLLPRRLRSKQARLEAARRRPLIRLAVALRVAAPAIVRIVQPAALLLGVHLHAVNEFISIGQLSGTIFCHY